MAKSKKKTVRKSQPEKLVGFSLSQRQIYRYWNGEKQVAADPIQVQRALAEFPDLNLDIDYKLLDNSDGKVAMEALGRIVNGIRHAFKVNPYEEVDGKPTGLTEGECIGLLAHFGSYFTDLKKKAVSLPTSATSAVPASSDVHSPTPSSSDSGLIAAGSYSGVHSQ